MTCLSAVTLWDAVMHQPCHKNIHGRWLVGWIFNLSNFSYLSLHLMLQQTRAHCACVCTCICTTVTWPKCYCTPVKAGVNIYMCGWIYIQVGWISILEQNRTEQNSLVGSCLSASSSPTQTTLVSWASPHRAHVLFMSSYQLWCAPMGAFEDLNSPCSIVEPRTVHSNQGETAPVLNPESTQSVFITATTAVLYKKHLF